jgi:membrane protease YdiL (CAAX protease family)
MHGASDGGYAKQPGLNPAVIRHPISFSESSSVTGAERVRILRRRFVIGHNVFHIVPNEVIVLSVLGLISIRLRDGSWSAMGLKRPASWRRILLIALVAAILRILLGQFLIEPLTGFFWPKTSAFGEEVAYRGYLVTRAADIGRRSAAAYWIGIVLVSILFGYGHYYKGASGLIDSGASGLILGTAYMLAGRNLWASILAHRFIDTFGVIDAFFGWSN